MDVRDSVIYIFRYCLLRNTYAVSTAQDIILYNMKEFSEFDLNLYVREIKEAQEIYTDAFQIDKSWQYIVDAINQELRLRDETSSMDRV